MTDPETRIGDAERASAMEALGEHMRAGRLDPHEYDERVEAVTAARTRSQLDPLFADLPAPHPNISPVTLRKLPESEVVPAADPADEQGPLGGRAGAIAVAVSPFVATLLFFVTGYQWWWFLLIPLAGAIVYSGGRSDDHRDRDERRQRRNRDRGR